jgi:hypothetical protein
MQLRSARILLGIFILSVSLIQVIELGHSILHHFENPIHYHQIRKVKDFKDHSLVDHHFPKMKFAHEMDETRSHNNFIALAYGFFQAFADYKFSCSPFIPIHYTGVIKHYCSVHFCPPTPPPLQIILS